jgi:hypothetical protein
MDFQHSSEIWRDFPELVPGVVFATASSDVPELIATIAAELNALWSITPAVTVLSQSAPRFTFPS